MGPMLSKATPVGVWEEPNPRSGGLPSMEPLSKDLPACPASPTWREASWGRMMTHSPPFPLPMPWSLSGPSQHGLQDTSIDANAQPWHPGHGGKGARKAGTLRTRGVRDASFRSSPSAGPSLGLSPAQLGAELLPCFATCRKSTAPARLPRKGSQHPLLSWVSCTHRPE